MVKKQNHVRDFLQQNINICVLTTVFPKFSGDIYGIFILRFLNNFPNTFKINVICPHENGLKYESKLQNISIHRFVYFFPKKLERVAYRKGMIVNLKIDFLAKIQFPFFLFFFFLKSLREAKASQIIHGHFSLTSIVACFLNFFLSIPIIITLRGSENLSYITDTQIKSKASKYIFNQADKIICLTNNQKNLMKNIGISDEKIIVIPNSVDISKFSFKPYNENSKKLIFVGRLSPEKRIDVLLKAVQIVVKDIQDITLIIVGDGPLKDELIKLTKDLSINNHVIFVGRVLPEKIPNYLYESDIFIISSNFEGCPNSLLEAMATGIPVIGTNVGGIPDIIDDGINGYLIENGDYQQLAEKIKYIFENPSLRVEMGKSARKKIENEFSVDRQIESHMKIYKELIDKYNGSD